MIAARLDAVAEIAESMGGCSASIRYRHLDEDNSDTAAVLSDMNFVLSSVLSTLGQSPDVQRGVTRIFHKTANPSEVVSLFIPSRFIENLKILTSSSWIYRLLYNTRVNCNSHSGKCISVVT